MKFHHQFTIGKSIKDEHPRFQWDRVIKSCKSWNWDRVFNPPKQEVAMSKLKGKMKPLTIDGHTLKLNQIGKDFYND